MSTKIYTGFKIGNMSFKELLAKLQEFQLKANAVVQEESNKYVALRATTFFDRCTLLNNMKELETASAFVRATKELMERQQKIKQTSIRDPLADFGFELTFFPLEGYVLGIYFCENKRLSKLWMDLDWVEEYGYWNNTDKPEELSDEQWKVRELDWEKALPGSGIPAQCGFSFTVTDTFYIPTIKGIMPFIPTVSERAKGFALDLLFQERLSKLKKEDVQNEMVAEYHKFNTWIMDTEEGKQAVENKQNTLIRSLKLGLTEFDLSGGLIK